MSTKNSEVSLEDIVSLCKRRGFIYQGSEIYGGLAGTWDYGPLGVQLKRAINNLWWKTFVEDREDMFGIDAAILMNQKVWQASGHVAGFNDPLVEDMKTKKRYRADHLLEDNDIDPTGMSYEQMDVAIKEGGLKSPEGNKLSKVSSFNMMFKTVVGAKYTSWDRKEVGGLEGEIYFKNKKGDRERVFKIEDSDNELGGFMLYDSTSVSYLRPETAQGMFVNFKNVVDSFYPDLPFGTAQIGKAFRNEISPRDFIFRVRELEQMEIEYFVNPEGWREIFDQWLALQKGFLINLGLPEEGIHQVEISAEDRAHYSKHSVDTEFDFPFGQKELLGLAYRTDYDLSKHQEYSGKNMEYRPKDGSPAFIPHVIEPTFGLDRLFLAVLSSAYKEDEVNGEKRAYLALPEHLAPVKYAVSPLLKNKPELAEKAREVYIALKKKHGAVMWDDNGNIGKRYRRQDEIGTPYCVVIDFDTLEDDTVTIRHRDTTQQERIKIADLLG